MQTATQKPNKDTHISSIRAGECSSLSGKSTLQYCIGKDENSAIYFQVTGNSGSGFFSRHEWISLDAIVKALGESESINSFMLHGIYKGRSLNNSGFLWAVLKQEGLILSSADKAHSYQRGDYAKFISEVQALVTTPVDASPEAKPKKTKKVAAKA